MSNTDQKEAAIERLARAIEKRIPYQIDWDEIGWAEAVARIAIEQGVVPVWREIEISCTEPHLEIPWDAVCAGEVSREP